MCGEPKTQRETLEATRDAMEPEKSLASMLRADLNVDVNPQALRMFVRARWSRVSKLAHSIHEPA